MYSIIRAVIMLYILYTIETTLAAENGYIVTELDLQCQEPTSVSSTCVGFIDYNVPDFNSFPKIYGLSNLTLFNISFINLLSQALRPFGEKCSNAGVKYLCEAAHPFRCEDEFIRVDLKELQATCNEARKDCSQFSHADTVFNCSAIQNIPGLEQQIPRKLICGDFPDLKDDPYTCDANYKVYSQNETLLQMLANSIIGAHKTLKQNSDGADKECQDTVADVICKAFVPACSIDRTKLVALLSKQDCLKMVGCVSQTNNADLIQQANAICDHLPDNTAKTYPLKNVYIENKAASHTMAFSTILFIAILVAHLVF